MITERPVVYIEPNVVDRWKGLRERQPKPKRRWQVRWRVDGRKSGPTFPSRAVADDFHRRLQAAEKAGEWFDPVTKKPVSWDKSSERMTYPELVLSYVFAEWAGWLPHSRSSSLEGLVRTIPLFVHPSATGVPEGMTRYLSHHFLIPKPVLEADPECVAWLNKHALPVDAITKLIAENVYTALGRGKRGQLLALNTAKRYRGPVAACFNRAVDTIEIIPVSPWPKAKLGRRKKKAKEMAPATTVVPDLLPNEDEGQQMLDALVNDKWYSLIHYAVLGTIFYSGLRPSETLGLEPEDAELEDEENAWFHVRGAKPGGIASRWFDPGEDQRTGVKGLARNDVGRSVPIDPMWARHLRWVLKQCPPKNSVLFSTEYGTSPTPSNLNRALTRAKKAALPPLVPARPGSDLMIPNPLLKTTPYDLRHARASLWLKKFDPTQVAAFLGHSPDVLLRIYANCVSGDLSVALAAIKAGSVDRPFPSRRRSVPHLSHSTREVGSPAIQSVA